MPTDDDRNDHSLLTVAGFASPPGALLDFLLRSTPASALHRALGERVRFGAQGHLPSQAEARLIGAELYRRELLETLP